MQSGQRFIGWLHIGTGYTGTIALRQILRSPRLELVGHLVHSPDKVGRDSGELVGESAVGVTATDSLEDSWPLTPIA